MTPADVVLTHDDQRLEILLRGGRIQRYRVRGDEVLAGVQSPDGPFAYRNALLAPWPNRVTAGRWSWRGEDLQLQVNQPETNSALHGSVVHVDFQLAHRSADSCTLVHRLQPHPGYPFGLTVTATYALGPDGLTASLTAENTEPEPVPIGLGVHPYIETHGPVDDVVMTLPAGRMLVTDDEWRERERPPVAGTDDDFRSGRSLRSRAIDAAFTDLEPGPDGRVHGSVRRPDGTTVRVWGGDTCRWLVVYTGDTLSPAERRRSMCIEPMTCGPNAFVSGEVDIVEPGARLVLDWGVSLDQPVS